MSEVRTSSAIHKADEYLMIQSVRLQRGFPKSSMQELIVKKDDLYVSRVSPIPSIKALTFTEGVHSYSSDIGCLQVGQIFNFPQHKIKV